MHPGRIVNLDRMSARQRTAFWAMLAAALLLIIGGWLMTMRSVFAGAKEEAAAGIHQAGAVAQQFKEGTSQPRDRIRGQWEQAQAYLRQKAEEKRLQEEREQSRAKREAAEAWLAEELTKELDAIDRPEPEETYGEEEDQS